jgi:hypothetical protein
MGTVLNVVIGLIFVFLVFSLVVSAVNEAFTALFAVRAKILWQTIRGFGASPDDPIAKLNFGRIIQLPFTASWLEKLPLIGKRAKGWVDPRPPVTGTAPVDPADFVDGVMTRTARFDPASSGNTRVKHVEPQVISQVVLELGGALPAQATTRDDLIAQGQAFLAKVQTAVQGTQLEAPVKAAILRAGGDIEVFRKAIEDWFDARMTALSKLYKMWSRWIMLIIAITVALVLNLNPIRTVDALRKDTALAQATVDQAQVFADKVGGGAIDVCAPGAAGAATTTTTDAATRVGDCYVAVQNALARGRQLPPPLNFDHFFWGQDSWWQYLLGGLLGAVAISFGAPFWFDTLRKVMSLRR